MPCYKGPREEVPGLVRETGNEEAMWAGFCGFCGKEWALQDKQV